ncbi:MAG: hypothetical protein H7A51_19690 [Akkermansiaceae bacterium]|nr:hypothetical protein [Akkermansiaceae bacterium]
MNIRVLLFVLTFFAIVALALVPICLASENNSTPLDTGLTGNLWTGEALVGKPSPPRKKPDYKAKQTFTRLENGRSVTIQEVEPPQEAQKPDKPSPPAPPVKERTTPLAGGGKPLSTEFIVVSSTVYGEGDNTLTRLTVWNRNEQLTCWSNINGHYLTGFDQFKVEGQPYWMIPTAGDKAGLAQAADDGCPVHRFGRGGSTPRFILEKDRQTSPGLRKIVSDLHKLYRVEKPRLAAAHAARTRNARLRAGLPKPPPGPPEPVTIRFWRRDMAKEQEERGAGQ